MHTQSYDFDSAAPREKDSFGLDTGGRIMLVEAGRFGELVTLMAEKYMIV
jgi:protein BCP1